VGKGIHRFSNRLVSASSCFVVTFFLKVRMGCIGEGRFFGTRKYFLRSKSACLLSHVFCIFCFFPFWLNIVTWLF
jgi:hypothetical protein